MNEEDNEIPSFVLPIQPPESQQSQNIKIEKTDFVEKQPLIDENNVQHATYWKGSEFLKTNPNLNSSKLSINSGSSSMCRICHSTSSTRTNPLISPCRCSGTLLHVHKGCVVKWLEMSTRKMVPTPKCELCGYDYQRANIFQIRSIHAPHVDRYSCILNILLILTIFIMILSGYFTIKFIQENAILKRRSFPISSQSTYWKRRGYFGTAGTNNEQQQIEQNENQYQSRLPVSSVFDIKVISCSIIFLISFIVALFTQYRAECTIFRCIFRFFVINKNWMIKNYDIRNDPEIAIRRNNATSTANSVPLTDPIVLSPTSVSQILQNN